MRTTETGPGNKRNKRCKESRAQVKSKGLTQEKTKDITKKEQ